MITVRYGDKDYHEPPRKLPWWKRPFVSEAVKERHKYDTEQVRALFAESREQFVEELEQQTIQEILHDPLYNPTYDMLSIQELAREYQETRDQEKKFLAAFTAWLEEIVDNPKFEKIKTLVMTLGFFASYEFSTKKPSIATLQADLQKIQEDTSLGATLLKAGLPAIPTSSSAEKLSKGIEDLQTALIEMHKNIATVNAMKSPEELAESFIEKLKEKYTDSNGSITREDQHARETMQRQLVAYKELYEKKQADKELRLENMKQTRGAYLPAMLTLAQDESDDLVDEIDKDINQQKEAIKQLKQTSDHDLEKLVEHLTELQQTIQQDSSEKKAMRKKRHDTMKLCMANIPTSRKVDYADPLVQRTDRYKGQEKRLKILTKLGKTNNSLLQAVQDEQQARTLAKIRAKYTNSRNSVCTTYEAMKKKKIASTLAEINKERKLLGHQLLAGTDNSSENQQKIENLEKRAANLSHDQEILDACEKALPTLFNVGSLEERLARAHVNVFNEERRQTCIETLATQELDGMDPTDEHFFALLEEKKQAPQTQKNQLSHLPTGLERTRIETFRANFSSIVTGNYKNTRSIEELIEIAKELETGKDKVFALNSYNGLSVGSWCFPDGQQRHIGNGGSLFTEQDAQEENTAFFATLEYNQTLRPGTTIEPRWSAIREDVSQRPSVIQEKTKDLFDAHTKPMHHTGETYVESDFYKTCLSLRKTQNPPLSEDDALVIMMYLQGLYGRYWVGGNRGCVLLRVVNRWFDSYDRGGGSASLLVSVKHHLLPPSGARGSGGPLSPEAQARFDEGKIEYGRMQQWRDNNVVNEFGTTLIDQNTGQSQDYTDESVLKTELSRRIEALRTAGHINLLPPPGGDLHGVTVQFTHPSRKNGTPKHFYEGQRVDYEHLAGAPSDNCLSKYNGSYANQKRLCVNLRSIRGDINTPDMLDDTVWEDQKNKTGKSEKNYTKTYLQALKQKQPTMKILSKKENEDFIRCVGTILGIPDSNQKLQLIAFQKILSFGGDFWSSDYTGIGNRGCVSLSGGSCRFDSSGFGGHNASLLVSRE